jgi:hypothetical protein
MFGGSQRSSLRRSKCLDSRMSTLFRKTPKGSAEIATREYRLSPRLRSLLILVDGQRSDDDLRKMITAQFDESLAQLRERGFIEAMASSHSTPSTATAKTGAAAPASALRPAKMADQDFATLRRDAVRLLTDQIGPMSESLAIRMERARGVDELSPLLATAAQLIGNARGAPAAAAYLARFNVT